MEHKVDKTINDKSNKNIEPNHLFELPNELFQKIMEHLITDPVRYSFFSGVSKSVSIKWSNKNWFRLHTKMQDQLDLNYDAGVNYKELFYSKVIHVPADNEIYDAEYKWDINRNFIIGDIKNKNSVISLINYNERNDYLELLLVYLKDNKLHQQKIFFEFKDNKYFLNAKCISIEEAKNYNLESFDWSVSPETLIEQLNSGGLNKPIKGTPSAWCQEFLLSHHNDKSSGIDQLDKIFNIASSPVPQDNSENRSNRRKFCSIS